MVKDIVKPKEDSPKKKEVNWQASVEKEVAQNKMPAEIALTPALTQEPKETAATMQQKSLQRNDSNLGAGKLEQGGNQTGTAKRKKKKKEEVFISTCYPLSSGFYSIIIRFNKH